MSCYCAAVICEVDIVVVRATLPLTCDVAKCAKLSGEATANLEVN